jgi:clan AA aspartic protease
VSYFEIKIADKLQRICHTKDMGNVYAEITVTNKSDLIEASKGQIAEKDVRSLTMTVLVDTGASNLIINDEICRQLGLGTVATREANLAGGGKGFCKITETVQVQWKDRIATVDPIAFPDGKPLLGVIPLEILDLIVDPVRHELVGAHGDEVVLTVM